MHMRHKKNAEPTNTELKRLFAPSAAGKNPCGRDLFLH